MGNNTKSETGYRPSIIMLHNLQYFYLISRKFVLTSNIHVLFNLKISMWKIATGFYF